jgi:hypothetical protein
MFQTRFAKTINILCSIIFFNRAIYDIMWKNNVEPDRPQMAMWCLRTVRRITMAKNTHSEYVTIIAFALQQWLHKSASMLCYEYIACLVLYIHLGMAFIKNYSGQA